jgi:hypothetical protein
MNQENSASVIVNASSGERISATLIFNKEFRAEIVKSLVCSNCKNPVDKCGICGRVFKSRDPVYCSLLNVHYCAKCVKGIRKAKEKYRPRKRGAEK